MPSSQSDGSLAIVIVTVRDSPFGTVPKSQLSVSPSATVTSAQAAASVPDTTQSCPVSLRSVRTTSSESPVPPALTTTSKLASSPATIGSTTAVFAMLVSACGASSNALEADALSPARTTSMNAGSGRSYPAGGVTSVIRYVPSLRPVTRSSPGSASPSLVPLSMTLRLVPTAAPAMPSRPKPAQHSASLLCASTFVQLMSPSPLMNGPKLAAPFMATVSSWQSMSMM